MPSLDDDSLLLEQWRRLRATCSRTSSALERRLEDAFGIGLSEFETLDQAALLSDAHASGPCAMRDLRDVSCLTQSALSRVVDRLEKAGLLERSGCPEDRRALFVQLTEAGARMHREAGRVHREVLREQLTPDRDLTSHR